MALCYKNLWKLLIDRDMTRKVLHRVSGVSHATLAKMSRGESVTASVLDRICNSLDCRIENVLEIIPDKPCEVNPTFQIIGKLEKFSDGNCGLSASFGNIAA